MAGISARGREEIARITSRGRRIISVKDAARTLALPAAEVAKRLARWESQGWLRRIRRGIYIAVPIETEDPDSWTEDPLVLASVIWAPCFFTGWTAANHWGLTEQVFRTTVLKTSARVRRNSQHLLGQEFLVVHADDSNFWGLKTEWHDEFRLLIADPARTVIDVLDQPRLGGGIRLVTDIVTTFLDSNESENLIEYGDRLGNMAVFKRLGYIIEELGLDHPKLLAALGDRIPSGVSLLDPSATADGPRIGKWGIRVNVSLAPREVD